MFSKCNLLTLGGLFGTVAVIYVYYFCSLFQFIDLSVLRINVNER